MSKLGLVVAISLVLLALAGCVAPQPTAPAEGQPFDWTIIIFLVAIFGLMYFVMIRPQRKRQKEHQQMVEALKRGDKVVTAGGIYGQIESLDETSVLIKVESGAIMRVTRGSVVVRREP